jgi:uncharacterized protein (DUF2141 family)
VPPGRYAFVIFIDGRGHGAPGTLFAETTRKLLRVEPRGASVDPGGDASAPDFLAAAARTIVRLVSTLL